MIWVKLIFHILIWYWFVSGRCTIVLQFSPSPHPPPPFQFCSNCSVLGRILSTRFLTIFLTYTVLSLLLFSTHTGTVECFLNCESHSSDFDTGCFVLALWGIYLECGVEKSLSVCLAFFVCVFVWGCWVFFSIFTMFSILNYLWSAMMLVSEFLCWTFSFKYRKQPNEQHFLADKSCYN